MDATIDNYRERNIPRECLLCSRMILVDDQVVVESKSGMCVCLTCYEKWGKHKEPAPVPARVVEQVNTLNEPSPPEDGGLIA